MNKITGSLKKCDFFSVTYSPAISDGMNYNHSSILGGVISIMIAILSLIYCLYYMYLWWSYQLLPKVTEDVTTFDQNTNFTRLINSIQFELLDVNGPSPIDPFKSDEIVLLPLLFDFENAEANFISLISQTNNGSLYLNTTMGKDSQWILIFTLCKEEYLVDDQKCATDEQKAAYFSQIGNAIYGQMSFTTINPSTFEPQNFLRTYQIYIQSQAEMCSTVTLHYQLNHYLINKAFLFSTGVEEQNYISDSLNYPTYAMKSYCDQFFLPDTYGAYWVLFQQQYKTISIAYPSISEVFAAIGSIISILFSVKYLITVLNLSQMRDSVLDDIMKQYYPEIRQFQIKTNLWGKIQSVKFRGFPVQIPSYLAFQKQIHQ